MKPIKRIRTEQFGGDKPFIPKGFRLCTDEEQKRLKGITYADELLLEVHKAWEFNKPISLPEYSGKIKQYLENKGMI